MPEKAIPLQQLEKVVVNDNETPAETYSFDASLKSKRKGRSLKWSNLNFSTKAAKGDSKSILDGMWGEVRGGQATCILGPSGAGKSSLLNVLCGRIAHGGNHKVQGSITLDGSPVNPGALSYKRSIAYVMQDDATWPTLTCRESLEVAATLRLPNSVSKTQKTDLVEGIIKELGLTGCADTLCGGELVKGLSGGEKKRTCIGLELISSPALLFLDEPTSGLDAYSALQCVELLRTVARAGSTVLCTIHQPSSEIFQLFDACILLKSGRVVYQGPVKQINAHFNTLGYPIPTNYNPADHVMSVVQKVSAAEMQTKNLFMEAPAASSTVDTIAEPANQDPIVQAGFCQQLSILVWREYMNVRRDPGVIIGRFGIVGVLNLIFGLIFFGAGGKDDSKPENLQSHFGALTFLTISAMFGHAQATLLTFPFEKPVFLREYSSGMYNGTAYIMSKIIAEIPLCFLQCVWALMFGYFMIDLQGSYWGHVAAHTLLGLAASSVAMVAGAAAPDVKTATEMAPGLLVPQLLFAGFFIRVEQIPIYLRWAQYLCSLKYTMNLNIILEFGSKTCPDNMGCESILSTNDVNADRWWVNVVVLLGLFIAFRLLAIHVLVQTAKKFY